jgi:RecA/RadA recombinase
MDLSKEEKLAKIKGLMKEINKGQKEVILDFASSEKEWERISCGVPEIDKVIGGGFPYGHTSIVWGSAGSGKSTLMYFTVAEAQKMGKVVAFLDLENSFNNDRASKFGVDCSELIVGHYSVAEQALDTIVTLAKEGAVDVIILDSIHSLAPKGELEDKKGAKSLESDTMALLARKLAQFFRMASTYIYNSNIALIMIGQTRTDLGGFIALQKLSGGNALIHNSVLTLYQRRGQKGNAPFLTWKEAFVDPDGKFHLQTKKEQDGFESVIKIDKKKCSGGENEGTEISVPYYYDTGFVIPNEENEVIKIDPAMNEEQIKIINDTLEKKGLMKQVDPDTIRIPKDEKFTVNFTPPTEDIEENVFSPEIKELAKIVAKDDESLTFINQMSSSGVLGNIEIPEVAVLSMNPVLLVSKEEEKIIKSAINEPKKKRGRPKKNEPERNIQEN